MPFYLSCPSATFALQHGRFVSREWPAAKGLFNPINPFSPCFLCFLMRHTSQNHFRDNGNFEPRYALNI